MSDNWIIVVPEDPEFVPEDKAVAQCIELLKTKVPTSDEVEVRCADLIQLHHPYGNWAGVRCPACGDDLDDWFSGILNKCNDDGLRTIGTVTPCCDHETTLNELDYGWSCRFARFSIELMNPNIPELAPELVVRIESILGSKICQVFQHL